MWNLYFSERVSLLLLTVQRHPQHLAVKRYTFMWILGKVALHYVCLYFCKQRQELTLPFTE